VVDDDIDASHAALLALTGSPVIGVFHTLSEGKTGQCVPGSTCPATFECADDTTVGRPTALAVFDTALKVANAAAKLARRMIARCRMRLA